MLTAYMQTVRTPKETDCAGDPVRAAAPRGQAGRAPKKRGVLEALQYRAPRAGETPTDRPSVRPSLPQQGHHPPCRTPGTRDGPSFQRACERPREGRKEKTRTTTPRLPPRPRPLILTENVGGDLLALAGDLSESGCSGSAATGPGGLRPNNPVGHDGARSVQRPLTSRTRPGPPRRSLGRQIAADRSRASIGGLACPLPLSPPSRRLRSRRPGAYRRSGRSRALGARRDPTGREEAGARKRAGRLRGGNPGPARLGNELHRTVAPVIES